MRTLRDLLTTWETWAERSVNRRALANATTDEQRAVMSRALEASFELEPLDVLRDVNELVSLLSGWRWQVVQDARHTGATWDQIGAAMGLTSKAVRGTYAATMIEGQLG